jgi:hypothetical protein
VFFRIRAAPILLFLAFPQCSQLPALMRTTHVLVLQKGAARDRTRNIA